MARIRSIKPEFWTSETIADLDVGTRLTFIGLWSYVDDNGVGVYNERLVASSLYPMDDPREALARIREAFARLSAKGRVALYETSGKRYVYVTTWDEHQRVDKPRKPRYPRPDECEHTPLTPPPTCGNTPIREPVAEPSREPREPVATPQEFPALEQGAGSREQGSREQGVPPTADALPARRDTAQTLLSEWLDHCPKRPPKTVIGHVAKQLRTLLEEGIDPGDIRAGLAAWHTKGLHPATLPSVVNEVMNRGAAPPPAPRPSTTDQRVSAALALAQKYAEQEAAAS